MLKPERPEKKPRGLSPSKAGARRRPARLQTSHAPKHHSRASKRTPRASLHQTRRVESRDKQRTETNTFSVTSKIAAFAAALALFTPFAIAALAQAAQIVA
jgi:hypothetical protein